MKIHIVEGSTGEYSDHCEWVICAYTDEEKAKEHAELASARARELIVEYKKGYLVPDGLNEYDPDMYIDYTGIDYTTYICELIEEGK